MRRLFPVLLLFLGIFLFFQPFFLKQLLPIPSDTIIGLYHPYRDFYAVNYPRGIPFKNFLITDPVRQEYPWRFLSVEQEKQFLLPLWNPYNGLGTPLLGNQQSASFYPFNMLFFILPFALAWSSLIVLSMVFGAWFLYLYLKQLRLSQMASVFGGITFAFSGFFISWLEWNTIAHVLMWLPFILFSIEKLFISKGKKFLWAASIVGGILCSFLAGHLQTFFYVGIITVLYYFVKLFSVSKKNLYITLGIVMSILVILLSLPQLLPLLQFIKLSGRSLDQVNWQQPGWFVPWQHLIQFIFPDFFGNPTTLNYWGIWNYGELTGYVGILPLCLSLTALLFVRRRIVFFFGGLFAVALLFALPTPLAQLPFMLRIPFLETAQPTRLMGIIDFSLSVLAAFGMDYFIKTHSKKVLFPVVGLGALMGIIVFFLVVFHSNVHFISPENITVALHNSIFPLVIYTIIFMIVIFILLLTKFNKKTIIGLFIALIAVSWFDSFRFAQKFTPFNPHEYLFPTTSAIQFLQKHIGNYRIMENSREILPPNFSIMYHVASVDIYDPLFLERYGEFIAAIERGKPNIQPPFGFNRIITPEKVDSPFINLLGVKYVLSLTDIKSDSLIKVFEEGQTKIYENKNVLPKAFFVENVVSGMSRQNVLNKLFETSNFQSTAFVEDKLTLSNISAGSVDIASYTPNQITIATQNNKEGFLVLTDTYYPTWHAFIDGKETTIYLTDFTFRGIRIPPGKHTIVFYNYLF